MEQRIRRAVESDADAVRAIYAPYITDSATSFEAVVPDVAEMAGRIQAYAASHPWLVFERDREVVGYAYASPHRARKAYQWSAEVSVYIDASAHRCGKPLTNGICAGEAAQICAVSGARARDEETHVGSILRERRME